MTPFVVFGALFGFVLARIGATEFSAIHRMFLLEDLHLAGVMATAIALSALGYAAFRRGWWRVKSGEAPNLKPKPMQRGLVLGALLFGVGWGLSGTCPGTAITQVGQGALAGVVTLAGILLGAAGADRLARERGRGVAAGETAGPIPAGPGGCTPG
jgi:hypothetical protein